MRKAEQKTAVAFLYVRFRANTAKHTAKPGKVQSASSGPASCYITRSFPPLSFPIKMGKKRKKKTN